MFGRGKKINKEIKRTSERPRARERTGEEKQRSKEMIKRETSSQDVWRGGRNTRRERC